MSEDTVNEWLDHLAERLKQEIEGGAAPAPERLTVRQLLSNFGYARRGRRVVSEIREQLGSEGYVRPPTSSLNTSTIGSRLKWTSTLTRSLQRARS